MQEPSTKATKKFIIGNIMKSNKLKKILDEILVKYAPKERLEFDPLQFPHRYKETKDIEAAAFLSALFAFGNVTQILSILETIFKILGKHPADFIINFDFKNNAPKFNAINHRWIRGKDLAALLFLLQQVYLKHGSLHHLFLSGYKSGHTSIRPALSYFNHALSDFTPPLPESYKTKGFRFFLADPLSGSPCKRWNLFLRWMVRKENGLDLGLWNKIPTSKLIIPLDTHIARIGCYLGLTHRTTPSWTMAEEITNSLAKFDKDDPVKYDFALCHFGISKDFARGGVELIEKRLRS